MPITAITTDTMGSPGQALSIIYINCTDTVDQITTAGYLNGVAAAGYDFNNNQAALVKGSAGMAWYQVTIAPGVNVNNYSLVGI